ncbi:hypothetical protein H6802_02555 [Candidatus Nomurabacteria bacterium]|uniref:Heat-inducible transcription repressor HrcA n=1 Tax=candidate division WWE3 bacterium TaxID=2053526 RepID=A0A955E0K6_UNCKA|nr:hypothetical protein [candidate division WWE3 bacterium]MCB9823815.1 hypothetical protein [Candidatus Nomurabacteria bacterium]MCB9826779.1 hypothetical protein [Candidatus Nomurabacteria bacterium]MCB9827610.1 hypothetical protein [Candidatus Nomurabacteria bacterium]
MLLTERQINLLKAIIEEYLDTAQPVGSSLIVEKYNVKCSPATVRNEMARLLSEGFLQMEHTSSGRIPTSSAYKFFLEELMEEEELDVLQEVAMKQKLWANRYEFEKLLRQAVLALSEITQELALATTDDGYVIHAGSVNLLDHKEFTDENTIKSILHMLDRHEALAKIFEKISLVDDGEVKCLIGADLEHPNLEGCSAIVAKYSVGKRKGYIAVLGPSRLQYQRIIPSLRYTKNLVEELGGSW